MVLAENFPIVLSGEGGNPDIIGRNGGSLPLEFHADGCIERDGAPIRREDLSFFKESVQPSLQLAVLS